MTHFISWIERDGKNWFLTKNELNSDKGKKMIQKGILLSELTLLEYFERNDDLVGHGAIRYYYNLKGGCSKKCTDFSDPSRFPAEIAQTLKDGLFEGVGLSLNILTSEAGAEYGKIEQPALVELTNAEKQSRIANSKATHHDWKKYIGIRNQACMEYCKIEKEEEAWSRYESIQQPAYAKYIKSVQKGLKISREIRQPAYAKYQEITQQTFWKLFKDPNNRIECWR